MIGQDGEREGSIDSDGNVALYWDADQDIDTKRLEGVLDAPAGTVWTDVTVGAEEPFDGVWLRLSAGEHGTCRIEAKPAALEAGLRRPAVTVRTAALVQDSSLAYMITERVESEEEPHFRLGAIGYGPVGEDLAFLLSCQIRAWGEDRTAQPVITAYPADTPHEKVSAGYVIGKPSCRLVIAYSEPPAPLCGRKM